MNIHTFFYILCKRTTNTVVEDSNLVHRFRHDKGGIVGHEVVENSEDGGDEFLKQVMTEEKWNKRVERNGSIDKIEDSRLDNPRRLESTDSHEILERFANKLSLFLKGRFRRHDSNVNWRR